MIDLSEMTKTASPINKAVGSVKSFVLKHPVQSVAGAAGAILAGTFLANNVSNIVDLYYKHNTLKSARQQKTNLDEVVDLLKSPKRTQEKEKSRGQQLMPMRLT